MENVAEIPRRCFRVDSTVRLWEPSLKPDAAGELESKLGYKRKIGRELGIGAEPRKNVEVSGNRHVYDKIRSNADVAPPVGKTKEGRDAERQLEKAVFGCVDLEPGAESSTDKRL